MPSAAFAFLALGAAMLATALGAGGLAAAVQFPVGIVATVATNNVSALLAAFLIFASAVQGVLGTVVGTDHRGRHVLLAYGGVSLAIALWAGLLAAGMTPVFWGLVRTPPEKRDMAAINAGIAKLHENFSVLDKALAGKKYVVGDSFTMGDIPAGAALYRYKAMDLNHPAMPNLDAYYKRLQDRPAYCTDIMIPLS